MLSPPAHGSDESNDVLDTTVRVPDKRIWTVLEGHLVCGGGQVDRYWADVLSMLGALKSSRQHSAQVSRANGERVNIPAREHKGGSSRHVLTLRLLETMPIITPLSQACIVQHSFD